MFRRAARIISSRRFCRRAWRSALLALQDLREAERAAAAGDGSGEVGAWSSEEGEVVVVERRDWRL
jgi:hypothetical protein